MSVQITAWLDYIFFIVEQSIVDELFPVMSRLCQNK